jgi:glycosyltransferase involved in cell wall biosynthesis
VDPSEFTPIRDGREPEFSGWPIVIFVGRLCEEKDVFDLMEAFQYVRSTLPQARLVLIGDGPARASIEIAADKSVLLLGAIKNRDLPPYFRPAPVIVSPSKTTRKWEEQVGIVNIQAMACGVPVVSTRSGAIPEYVPEGRAAILVPEGSPSDLADAILRLCIDSQLHDAMGQFARKYCLERYVMADNVRAFEDAVLEVCAFFSKGSTKEHSG